MRIPVLNVCDCGIQLVLFVPAAQINSTHLPLAGGADDQRLHRFHRKSHDPLGISALINPKQVTVSKGATVAMAEQEMLRKNRPFPADDLAVGCA